MIVRRPRQQTASAFAEEVFDLNGLLTHVELKSHSRTRCDGHAITSRQPISAFARHLDVLSAFKLPKVLLLIFNFDTLWSVG